MTNRVGLINNYFQFLISDYGFNIENMEFDYHSMGNAVVIYASPFFGIEVVIDRNQVLIRIGEIHESRKEWFDLIDVVNYYTHEEKKLYSFPEKNESNYWDEIIEIQLESLARVIYQFCRPILIGQPWHKEEIVKIRDKRVAEMLNSYSKKRSN